MASFKSKIITLLLALLMVFCLLPLSACGKSDKETMFLKTDGELVKNGKGETVYLRGVNAGGLFVTEHWMTGFLYGSSDSDDYRSLSQTFIKRFGEDDTKKLWAEYRANWWTEQDFKNCADMGMNVIRLPFSYMNLDFAAITDYEQAGRNYDFSALDKFVKTASEYGMYTILDLHGAYGSQNGQDHSGQILSLPEVDFYSNEQMMELTAKLWRAIATHYKDNPYVAGYDILNEPGEKAGSTSERHWSFYDRVYKSIRSTGDNHIVIFESCWNGENLPKPSQYGWENCMYSFHHYADSNLSALNHNVNWNEKIANVTAQNFGVPLQMGEFTSYSDPEKWEYNLDLLNRSGWHWTSWTYKVWGNMPWGIVNIIADSGSKVNASEDDYDEILNKFKILRTGGANVREHTLYTWNEWGGREEYGLLKDIFTQYCNAPYFTEKAEERVYIFSDISYDLALNGYVGNNEVLAVNDGGSPTEILLEYHTSKDGSAYLTVDGKYLTVINTEGNNYITPKTAKSNAARFYPVIHEGRMAFVSYSTCKYLRVSDGSTVTADANYLDEAELFYY